MPPRRWSSRTRTAKPGVRRIRPELWPDAAFVDVGIRGDLSELADARTVEQRDFTGELKRGKLIDAVARVMDRRMGEDPRIVVLGEDVHRLNGGTNGATKGLATKYPGRVLGTPISENAFAGLGGGLALDGRFRPVVEFMYPDFLWVAADQVFNQIGKARHMFGGRNPVPLVLRTKVAMGSGYGSQHLMDPAGIFATSPGWRIMAASTPYDYVGLMNAALALGDPVLMLEHVDLYGAEGEIPVDDLDYQIPFGQAAVRREGKDVTVLTYLSMVEHARQAIEQTGVDAELIDLRFLDRASLDWQTVGDEHRQDERGAHRRAGRAGHLLRRLARRRDPAPLLRLARPARAARDGLRGEPEHLQGARARGDRPYRGSRRRSGTGARRLREGRLMASVVRMPSVLAGATEAAIASWLVAPGDTVAVGDPLAEIETEKAIVEYGAEEAGVVGRIVLAAGEVRRDRRAYRGAREGRRDGRGHRRRPRRRSARRRHAAARAPVAPAAPEAPAAPVAPAWPRPPAAGREQAARAPARPASSRARSCARSPARRASTWPPSPGRARTAGSSAATSNGSPTSAGRLRARPRGSQAHAAAAAARPPPAARRGPGARRRHAHPAHADPPRHRAPPDREQGDDAALLPDHGVRRRRTARAAQADQRDGAGEGLGQRLRHHGGRGGLR